MKNARLSSMLSVAALLTGLSLIALFPQQAAAQDPSVVPVPGTYLITNVYSSGTQKGEFASRGAITLNADHTFSVIDSAEGGPTYYFGSYLGTWGVTSAGVVGRAVNFTYPPPSGAPLPTDPLARLDYTFNFGSDGTISGTIALYYFPLTADHPFGSGGVSGGTYTFTGYLVTLP